MASDKAIAVSLKALLDNATLNAELLHEMARKIDEIDGKIDEMSARLFTKPRLSSVPPRPAG